MKTEIKKRKYDNKFMVRGFMVDPNYNPKEFDEANIPYIPQRWVIVGVYDDKKEAYKRQYELSKHRAVNS